MRIQSRKVKSDRPDVDIVNRVLKWPGFLIFLLLIVVGAGESSGAEIGRRGEALTCGICGKVILSEYIRYENGPVYHRDCHDRAVRCKICGLPIGRHQYTAHDAAKTVYHRDCLREAPVCAACGLPITAGQNYRQAKGNGRTWHAACFDNASFCGITGKYIAPGSKTVRVGSEIFLKDAYDQAPKCIVSALPIANHGHYLVNGRTHTHVLEQYKSQTRQCYSCGDWLLEGTLIGKAHFLCSYCQAHAVKTSQAAKPYLEKAHAFFKAKGIRLPDNIDVTVLPPGQLVQGRHKTDMKGACNTTVTVFGGKHFYRHQIEILYGLNTERFAAVLIHELSHTVIAESLKYVDGREIKVPYEEGRCEYAAYRFALENRLPAYILESFASNSVAEYRDGFLYFKNRNPKSLPPILTMFSL